MLILFLLLWTFRCRIVQERMQCSDDLGVLTFSEVHS